VFSYISHEISLAVWPSVSLVVYRLFVIVAFVLCKHCKEQQTPWLLPQLWGHDLHVHYYSSVLCILLTCRSRRWKSTWQYRQFLILLQRLFCLQFMLQMDIAQFGGCETTTEFMEVYIVPFHIYSDIYDLFPSTGAVRHILLYSAFTLAGSRPFVQKVFLSNGKWVSE